MHADLGQTPVLNWDHPFMSEGETVDRNILVAEPAAFGLTFAPVVPVYATGTLRWVDVSSHATVAFLFDFSSDTRFGTDARAEVQESSATMTQDELITGPRPGVHSVTDVGSTAVLVLQSGGIADAMFIRDGVFYDIAGPALPPNAALDLATQLVKQLN